MTTVRCAGSRFGASEGAPESEILTADIYVSAMPVDPLKADDAENLGGRNGLFQTARRLGGSTRH